MSDERVIPAPDGVPDAVRRTQDPFARMRQFTRARIGLGRAGDALPTHALLAFQAAASEARDAVHASLDTAALRAALAPRHCIEVASRADTRTSYLLRPDLGRQLGEGEAQLDGVRGNYDIAFVIADGLSARAVMAHAVAMLEACEAKLPGWSIAPVVLASQARVALGDAVAQHLGARMVAVLIGERPGLSVADSLGVYLTWEPHADHPDSLRNCISNIHADGLDYPKAATLLAWLAGQARSRQLTGTALKPDLSSQAGISDEHNSGPEENP